MRVLLIASIALSLPLLEVGVRSGVDAAAANGSASPMSLPVLALPALALPEAEASASEIGVGDTLQAIRDVSLDEAVIAEGSKVSVSGKRAVSGAVVVDVALADGHVVKGLPLSQVKQSFRRVAN